MRVGHMRVNHLKNPCGYQMNKVTFSWITENSEGKKQKQARVVISDKKEFESVIYDSRN